MFAVWTLGRTDRESEDVTFNDILKTNLLTQEKLHRLTSNINNCYRQLLSVLSTLAMYHATGFYDVEIPTYVPDKLASTFQLDLFELSSPSSSQTSFSEIPGASYSLPATRLNV